MAKLQDCFKIEKDLKKKVSDLAKAKGMSRSTYYRMAIIEKIQRDETQKFSSVQG